MSKKNRKIKVETVGSESLRTATDKDYEPIVNEEEEVTQYILGLQDLCSNWKSKYYYEHEHRNFAEKECNEWEKIAEKQREKAAMYKKQLRKEKKSIYNVVQSLANENDNPDKKAIERAKKEIEKKAELSRKKREKYENY